MTKQALGKGISTLLENTSTSTIISSNNLILDIDIDLIKLNPFQPRTNFKNDALNELADSIKELGLIQPLTIRKKNKKYELISGERRLRSSKIAGLKKVPVYIRNVDDISMLEMALVENIQRTDLDPIEIAMSYQQLIKECKITQQELSKRIGKKRTTITNYIRLLKLPPLIQAGLRDGIISMGHARTLINVDNKLLQLELYREVVRKNLSVRKIEKLVQKKQKNKYIDNNINDSLFYKQIINKLNVRLQTTSKIKANSLGKGQLIISFKNNNELEDIVNRIQ